MQQLPYGNAPTYADTLTNGGTNPDIAKLVRSHWDHSRKWYYGTLAKITDWYNVYRAIYSGNVASYRNNVAPPLVFSIVQSYLAKMVSSTFAAWPIVTFQGYGPHDGGIAKKNEILISAQMKDCQSFRKAMDYLTGASLYGNGIARLGWTHIERLRRWRQRVLDQHIWVQDRVVEFDGPDWNPIDIQDCAPQPGKKYIEDMEWFIYRYYVDFDNLQDLNNGPVKLFSDEAIRKLKETPLQGDDAREFYNRFYNLRPGSRADALRTEEYGKTVCIKEMFGLVPREFAKDGIRMRLVTIANEDVVLRNDPLPFENGKIPILNCCPVHDPHDFFGISKAYIGEKIQAAAARMMNGRLDAMDLFLAPMFIGDLTKMPTGQNLFSKPGKVFGVRGNPAEVLLPLTPNLSQLQNANQEQQALWALLQQAEGMYEDAAMGGPSGSNRQTAREFLGRQEQVLTRLSLEAMVISTEFVEPLAEWFRDANKQFLSLPKEVNILGDGAIINPITGLPLPDQAPLIEAHDLNHDFRAKAVGPMLMLTQAMQQNNAMQLAQFLQSNPVLLQATNWIYFGRRVAQLMNFDSNELFVNQIPEITKFANSLNMNAEQLVNFATNPHMETLNGGQMTANGGQPPNPAQALMGPQGGAGGQQLGMVSPGQIGNQNPSAPLPTGP